MKTPQIDVIIAVYNGEKYITDAVASVQKQSWKNLNIIIADDGSTDSTLSIVKTLGQSDERIQILTLVHKGVSATLNAAIESSNAPYIAFLDADDLWDEQKLAKQMEYLAKNDGDICFCLMQEFEDFDQEEAVTHSKRSSPMKGYSKTAFLGKRTLFDTFGLFNKDVAIGDFVEWYSRVIRAELPILMLEEVLTFRRVHMSNTTRFADKNAFLSLLRNHLDEKRKG